MESQDYGDFSKKSLENAVKNTVQQQYLTHNNEDFQKYTEVYGELLCKVVQG